MLFSTKMRVVCHWSSTVGSYTWPHICFLTIEHILGFLVETIFWSKIRRCSLRHYWKWSFMAIFDKNGGYVAFDHHPVAHTPHPLMFPYHRSHSWISGGNHFLVKNPYVLAFAIIENGRSWLFSTKIGVVWPLIIDQRLVHLTPHMFPCHRSDSWIFGGVHFWSKIHRC
jgi:hypothetical protein